MRNVIFLLFFSSLTTLCYSQLSYNTTLLGKWSNDSLHPLSNPDGQRFNELWGYYDSAKAREYIVMGGTDSIYFFDVTNPSKIKLCDVEAGKAKNCVNRDFQTYKHYVYAVNDQVPGSLQVFDLQYLPDSVHKTYDSDTLGISTHTICAYKDKLYMCSSTSRSGKHAMLIASLQQPDSPSFVTVFDAPIVGGQQLFSNIHDMIIVDDTAYLSCGNDGLFIFEFSNPLAPKYVYSLSLYAEQGFNHNSSLTASKKCIIFTDENLGLGIKLYEIENATTYRLKSIFRSHSGAMAHNPFIVGNNIAYFSYYQDGVYKYDISDPVNPVLLAYYDTYPENIGYTGFQGCWGVYPFLPSGNIFASDMSHGLFALGMNKSGINGTSNNLSIQILPNPLSDKTELKLFSPSQEIALLEITDSKGALVSSQSLILQTGKNSFPISTTELSTGVYFVQIISSYTSNTLKLIKQ